MKYQVVDVEDDEAEADDKTREILGVTFVRRDPYGFYYAQNRKEPGLGPDCAFNSVVAAEKAVRIALQTE